MLAARFGDLALRLGRLLGEMDRRITPHRQPGPIFALRRFANVHGVTVIMPADFSTPGEVSAFSTPRHTAPR